MHACSHICSVEARAITYCIQLYRLNHKQIGSCLFSVYKVWAEYQPRPKLKLRRKRPQNAIGYVIICRSGTSIRL